MSGCRGLCTWCAGFLFTLGLIALFLWLSFRPSNPTFFIVDFYIPAANQTAGVWSGKIPTNTTISFGLKINNPNKDKGIYYDPINVTLGYDDQPRIGEALIPGFYQGFKKKATKTGVANATEGKFWEALSKAISSKNETPSFRVGMVTAVRYKILQRKTKHHKVNLVGNVEIDVQGKKKKKKGVKLGSDAPPIQKNSLGTGSVVSLTHVILILIIGI